MIHGKSLLRGKPEEQEVSSTGIQTFIKSVDASNLELHSFMLLRHGIVLAEKWWPPYEPERPHLLHSISKSFTSTAVGLAVREGLMSIEDQVIAFFPDEITPEIKQNMGQLLVSHLLTMSTGHVQDPTAPMMNQAIGNWIKGFLEIPVEKPPGTYFVYNSGASYILAAILHKVTGQSLLDYLQPRIFEPLGIEGVIWDTCPRGINCGGWGMSIRTEDMAKFGQFYLQKGEWNGQQLLPLHWVETATRSHISTEGEQGIDKQQGYGYQFYLCRYGYTARGAHGQFVIVLPEQDAVIAITSDVKNMQAVLDLVWEHLLPAFL
ncbi:serine hydrolase domain-containing protein [Paenibacillus radicis (ex Xue et al. 2023)]|uniref:Beta-lactamase family protein n=1 Tax=Paenibacillus radicis (ex Xue et al. 2023) TaxID=2972489 RepID=A0ABT1YBG6_9BACL|nr:serine hydrolase [Paenibacillus radicis (ex Xue et al. 2023)]MCR8630534.1 beta-lactamase family protein [Paenibacillus radicis (ex Xue et al. 2023)]